MLPVLNFSKLRFSPICENSSVYILNSLKFDVRLCTYQLPTKLVQKGHYKVTTLTTGVKICSCTGALLNVLNTSTDNRTTDITIEIRPKNTPHVNQIRKKFGFIWPSRKKNRLRQDENQRTWHTEKLIPNDARSFTYGLERTPCVWNDKSSCKVMYSTKWLSY